MDKKYEEDILAALERHSEKINHFIAQLKKLKPQSYMSSWIPFLSRGKQQKAGFKLHEASSSNHDYPKNQIENVKIHHDIQDIKVTIKTLEDKTERVIENLSPTETSVSEKGEDKSLVTHFQVYERDMQTKDFVTALKNRLPKRCLPDVIEKVSDIDINKPLIILCQSGSRLVPDINYSLEHFEELNSFTKLAIVIIHNKEGHALPTTSSQSKLSDDVRFKKMWIIDAAFTNALKFYDCKMNNEAIATIETFLKRDTSI